MIGSAIFSLIYIANGMYKVNIFMTILVIVLIISFVITLIYLISIFTGNSSIEDKMQFIGNHTKLFCLGIIVIFIVCIACSNMVQTESATTMGHVELDEAQVSIYNSGEEYVGHWELVGTGTNLGDAYQQKSPVVDQSIKLNLKDINWDGQVDDAKLEQALKTNEDGVLDNYKLTITLYDSDGNYINKYNSVPILKGQELIINNTLFNGDEGSNAFNFDKEKMDSTDVKYVEAELILENTNSTKNKPDYYLFDIISNRFEIK